MIILFSCSTNQERSDINVYDPDFRPLPAQMVPVNGLNNFQFPFAITRLENKKLTLMVRDSSGRMAPFFVRSQKTGKIDTILFKKEIMHWWWQHYTTAFHEIDPINLHHSISMEEPRKQETYAKSIKTALIAVCTVKGIMM